MLVYPIRPEAVRSEKRRARLGILTFFFSIPLLGAVATRLFRLDPRWIGPDGIFWGMAMITIVCAIVWVRTFTLGSLRIQLEHDRITRLQNHPLGFSPLRTSFTRDEISDIREIRNRGLMIKGRHRGSEDIDLHVPLGIENYDDLRARLSAWRLIHETRW